jgi:putative transposase
VLDAKLTLKDFTKMIIETILYRNNYHYMEYYPLDKAMVKDDLKPIARELWLWGLQHDHFLKEVHPDIVRLNVLPEAKATASREGIYFEGMYYGCEELAQQGWFVQGKSIKTVVAYDRRCMNYVYVKSKDGKSFIKCHLLEKSSRYRNLSLEEVKELRHEAKIKQAMYNDFIQLQQEVELSAKLEDIKLKAEQRMVEQRDHSLTKTERRSGIKENKKEMRNQLRKEQSYELGIKERAVEASDHETDDKLIQMDSYNPKSKISLLSNIKEGGNRHG